MLFWTNGEFFHEKETSLTSIHVTLECTYQVFSTNNPTVPLFYFQETYGKQFKQKYILFYRDLFLEILKESFWIIHVTVAVVFKYV